MKAFPSLATLLALVFSSETARAQVIEAEPGTELFQQFRPVYHFLARENWMNDPSAPYYDAETGLYHMFYQSNPDSTLWGNMTWGHAVSENQVTWKDFPDALLPLEDKWDQVGVFTGFSMDNAIDGKHTVFYSGVTALSISWYKPYLFGEHVVYATTSDGGKTWQKGAEPLIKSPPKGMNVTGWRDPMPFHSKSLDIKFGTKNGNYLLVAGGIRGEGPRIFLYQSDDYVDWKYKGFLLSQDKNTSFSEYSGNWGVNFETTIYREMTDDDGELHNVMLFAAQGDSNRYMMWATGTIGDDSASGEGVFTPLMVGVSDRSDWYANSIYTDQHGKDVVIGWITEDNGFKEGQPQGWDGTLSLPREVGIAIVRDIYDVDDHLVGTGDWIVSESTKLSCSDGSSMKAKTIKTLRVKPLSDLKLLRNPDAYEEVPRVILNVTTKTLKSKGASFELIAEVTDFERGSKVGFEVRSSGDGDEVTTIVYDDTAKKIIIDRSGSSNAKCDVFVDNDGTPGSESIWGNFYLYDIFNGDEDNSLDGDDVCEFTRESLNFHVFVDVSTVEVFVNDRFALSARIYPCEATSTGIALTASGDAIFEKVQMWTKPKHAWSTKRVATSTRVEKTKKHKKSTLVV